MQNKDLQARDLWFQSLNRDKALSDFREVKRVLRDDGFQSLNRDKALSD